MSLYIRKLTSGSSETFAIIAKGSWNLRSLISELEVWLDNEADNLPSGFKWIADVGFSPREDACGGGPILKVELMQKCVDLNMEIYLSEYTEDDDI